MFYQPWTVSVAGLGQCHDVSVSYLNTPVPFLSPVGRMARSPTTGQKEDCFGSKAKKPQAPTFPEKCSHYGMRSALGCFIY